MPNYFTSNNAKNNHTGNGENRFYNMCVLQTVNHCQLLMLRTDINTCE